MAEPADPKTQNNNTWIINEFALIEYEASVVVAVSIETGVVTELDVVIVIEAIVSTLVVAFCVVLMMVDFSVVGSVVSNSTSSSIVVAGVDAGVTSGVVVACVASDVVSVDKTSSTAESDDSSTAGVIVEALSLASWGKAVVRTIGVKMSEIIK